ncbi:MAG TPA: carbohydrate kinase family protein [Ktedonobacterales bacterium]|jgi:pseudouridine kinase
MATGEGARIVCIGGANVDRKAHCLAPARWHTSNPVQVSESYGGVARNVAENLGRLGCRPLLLTAVGDDGEGADLLAATAAADVATGQALRVPGARTGSYTAVLEPSGELVIALNEMGVTDELTVDALAARWERIAAAGLVFADTNLPPATLDYLIARCRDERLRLVIDPVSAIKAARLPERLDGVSAILPDRLEAAVLAGLPAGPTADGADQAPDVWEALAARIRDRGARAVVISLGAAGLFYSSSGVSFQSAALGGAVVDVTGAGDALAAGFLLGLLEGEPPERCCRLGLAAAALTVRSDRSVAPDMGTAAVRRMVDG